MTQRPSKSKVEQEIDDNLRRAFDDISQQELPDRFSQLLASLKDAERQSETGGTNDS